MMTATSNVNHSHQHNENSTNNTRILISPTNSMADDVTNAADAAETFGEAETVNLVRAMSAIENKDDITDAGELPPKEDNEAIDDDNNEEENSKNELADVVTPQKKQRQQPPRKRHGARNQHKMKHFVRWLLETFPDILVVQPSSSSSSSSSALRTKQGNTTKKHRTAIPCTCNTSSSSCNHDAKPQAEQKEDEVDLELSRTKTQSSPCCGPKEVDDAMLHDDDDVDAIEVPLILDVAGGKGELAARLCLCLHLRVVLVDPRPANIEQTYLQTVVPRLPKKWQERLQQRLDTNPNHVHDILEDKFHQVVDYFSYSNAVRRCISDRKHGDNDDNESLQQQLTQAVQDASLLIGMHADGATEDIIDVALHYQKPFVVVPCCVFANLYSHRQIRRHIVVPRDDQTTGSTVATTEERHTDLHHPQQQQAPPPPSSSLLEMTFASVRTHEQFCQYLLDKDARFKKSILPFEGRNVAIWWNGK
jgi:Methyltransferase domain